MNSFWFTLTNEDLKPRCDRVADPLENTGLASSVPQRHFYVPEQRVDRLELDALCLSLSMTSCHVLATRSSTNVAADDVTSNGDPRGANATTSDHAANSDAYSGDTYNEANAPVGAGYVDMDTKAKKKRSSKKKKAMNEQCPRTLSTSLG